MNTRLSTRFPRSSTALPAALLMCVPGLLSAQLRDTPDFAPFILDERVEREDYNLKLGPVEVDVIGTFGIEYDDNINTSENNPIEDVILQPGVSLGFKWQMTEFNELDLNIGAEYWHYLDNNELNNAENQLAITPNTELSFRVLIGDVVLRVYDRLQYSFDSADSVQVDPDTGDVVDQDPEAFTRFTNVAGVQSEWFIGETIFSAQLSRTDIWSPNEEFAFVDRTEHKAALNVERDLAANFRTGVGTSFTTFDFDDEVNNDGDVLSIGPYFDWKITDVIGLFAGVAWNDYDFDEGALTDTTPSGDESGTSDLSWSVRLSHVVNPVFNHQLEYYHSIDVSNTANFNELDGLRYSFSHTVNSRIRLDGALGYETNTSSGGLIDDDFDRWQGGLSTELRLGPRLTADIGYRYTDKDSEAELQSYEQNEIRVLFSYDF